MKTYITKHPRHISPQVKLLNDHIASGGCVDQSLLHYADQKTRDLIAKKPNKYGAKKTYCTARHLHDSGKESRRCEELMLLEKAGEIRGLINQPVYVLMVKPMFDLGRVVSDEAKKVGKFTADFQYFDARTDVLVVEDSKGFRKGEAYRLRKRLFEALYGVEVFES